MFPCPLMAVCVRNGDLFIFPCFPHLISAESRFHISSQPNGAVRKRVASAARAGRRRQGRERRSTGATHRIIKLLFRSHVQYGVYNLLLYLAALYRPSHFIIGNALAHPLSPLFPVQSISIIVICSCPSVTSLSRVRRRESLFAIVVARAPLSIFDIFGARRIERKMPNRIIQKIACSVVNNSLRRFENNISHSMYLSPAVGTCCRK